MPVPSAQLVDSSNGSFAYQYTRNVTTTTGPDGIPRRSGVASGGGSGSGASERWMYGNSSSSWSSGWTDTYSDTGVSSTTTGTAPTLSGYGIYANPDPYYGRSGSTPCFTAGTQVLVGYDEQGNPLTRNIEDLQVGDTVLSKDEHDPNDSIEPRRVTAVEVHTVTQIRLLGIEEADGSTEVLQTTDEHPFWVVGVGWVQAGELQVGQTLLTPDGRVATVASSSIEEHPEGISVYNLTVGEDHTFFVSGSSGEEMVWVHNAGPVGSPPSTTQPPDNPSDNPWKWTGWDWVPGVQVVHGVQHVIYKAGYYTGLGVFTLTSGAAAGELNAIAQANNMRADPGFASTPTRMSQLQSSMQDSFAQSGENATNILPLIPGMTATGPIVGMSSTGKVAGAAAEAAELAIASRAAMATRKAVNLPAWRSILIDMEEVTSGHMVGGSRLAAGNKKTLFPASWAVDQVEKAIRVAYSSCQRVRSQGDRVLVRGSANGVLIEMWVNTVTKTIETAYPVY